MRIESSSTALRALQRSYAGFSNSSVPRFATNLGNQHTNNEMWNSIACVSTLLSNMGKKDPIPVRYQSAPRFSTSVSVWRGEHVPVRDDGASPYGTRNDDASITSDRAYPPGSSSYAGHQRDPGMLVDTLSMMKRYESLGLSREQAEALTRVVTEVLVKNREMLAETYVSMAALEKSELKAEASISGFRAEVLKSQELQEATSNRETERLQANLDKVKSEIRYEVDKLTASQRLDLNLEKGRMRDELQSLRDKANELEIKVDKEVNSLKAAMEQSKNDTVKYMLGVVMALITAGLGAARLVI